MPETSVSYLSTSAAAAVLGIRPATLVKYSNEGRVRAVFYGRHWHYLHADLLAFADSNRRGGK